MNELDLSGGYLPLMEFEGCKFPPFPLEGDLRDHIRRIRDLTIPEEKYIEYARVFVIGFPKSGCSSLWPLLKSVIKHNQTYQDSIPVFHTLDCGSPDKLEYVATPRVLHTHYPLRFLPTQLLTHRPKVIYLLRNPKDVCVSQYQQLKGAWSNLGYTGTFDNFVNMFLSHMGEYGGWFHYVLQYRQDFKDHPELPVHVMYFEDMVQNPYKEMKSLCRFLDISIKERDLQEIVEGIEDGDPRPAKRLKPNPDNREFITPDTYYSRGEVGEWKEWLTVAQDEKFDKVIDEQLTGSGLNFQYTL